MDSYKSNLYKKEHIIPEDHKIRDPEFLYTASRRRILRDTLAELFVDREYRFFVLDVWPADVSKYHGFMELAHETMRELKNEGVLSWEEERFVADGLGYTLMTVSVPAGPAGDHTKN